MNKLYRIIIFLLVVSLTACTSTRSTMTVAGSDEDKDIGLGGTGMLATGTGIGGTGILGKITGFGSIFVNGIEIEYDNETAFTIDGKTAVPQQLEIGDVVEVLTTDDNKYTQAQIINLRHEVVGKVESVEPQTFSFTVHGQSVIQAINKAVLPEVGTTVAVSGFRIDEKTILSTRITSADAKQSLLRTHTDLPFKGKAARWLVQTHVRNDEAAFELDGITYAIKLKKKTDKTLNDRLGIKILKLQKLASGQLELDHVIESMALPRGRQTPIPVKQPGKNMMPGTNPGSRSGSIQGTIPGSIQGPLSGSMRNMKL
jgi:hypothetical protein